MNNCTWNLSAKCDSYSVAPPVPQPDTALCLSLVIITHFVFAWGKGEWKVGGCGGKLSRPFVFRFSKGTVAQPLSEMVNITRSTIHSSPAILSHMDYEMVKAFYVKMFTDMRRYLFFWIWKHIVNQRNQRNIKSAAHTGQCFNVFTFTTYDTASHPSGLDPQTGS